MPCSIVITRKKKCRVVETRGAEVLSKVQIKSDETEQVLNKPYVNEVYLTGQKLT